jgi:hypothetical protein
MVPDIVLHIANTEEFRWLLQPELKAIKNGLKFVEKEGVNQYGEFWKRRGYYNEKG